MLQSCIVERRLISWILLVSGSTFYNHSILDHQYKHYHHHLNYHFYIGHADFGGEVERIMNMVDGVLLVVDSVDGPKPQTRFVLKKALEKGIKAIVVVNKIDRPSARPSYVVDRVFDLFAELNASDEQMDFEVVYASGKFDLLSSSVITIIITSSNHYYYHDHHHYKGMNGIAGMEPDNLSSNLQPLFETILRVPMAKVDPTKSLQMLIANIDYDEFKGIISF